MMLILGRFASLDKLAACRTRDYKKEYARDHATPRAKRHRAMRNKWNRRLKGQVPAGYEIDHIRQLRHGGGNDESNIRLMRVSQNRSEHNREKTAGREVWHTHIQEMFRKEASWLGKYAGVATKRDPAKWERSKRDAVAKMGGKHSARAMQLATKLYKDRGGEYAGRKPAPSENKLRKWTKQKWTWSDGDRGVYLPKRSAAALKSTKQGREKLQRASAEKTRATRRGEQYAQHGLHLGKRRGEVS